MEGGWEVLSEGDRGGLVFLARNEALASARHWARRHRPATVILYSPENTIEQEYRYDDNRSMRGGGPPPPPRPPREKP